MALIVENGTGVASADTYVSAADAVARAAILGIEFPLVADADTHLIRAGIYLEKFRNQYQGVKYIAGQSLQWPRDKVYIDNEYNDPNNIPQLLIDAQISIAGVDFSGGNLFATDTGSATSKSVGDVSITKSNGGKMDNTATFGMADELLHPLMKNARNGLFEFDVCRA